MDDQIAMRVRHRVDDLQEEPELLVQRERVRLDVAIERHPVDVLHREPRVPIGSDAALEQARDARMLERREDLSLLGEAAQQHAILIESVAHHLERDTRGELGVVARGEIHGSHAAAAEHVVDDVRADARGRGELALDEQRLRPRDRARARRRRDLGVARGDEQLLDGRAQRRVAAAGRVEIGGPRFRRELERGVEDRLDALPELRHRRTRHVCSASIATASHSRAFVQSRRTVRGVS